MNEIDTLHNDIRILSLNIKRLRELRDVQLGDGDDSLYELSARGTERAVLGLIGARASLYRDLDQIEGRLDPKKGR